MCVFSVLSALLKWLNRGRVATIFLITALVFCSISLVAPFWMIETPASAYTNVFEIPWFGTERCRRLDTGLLLQCCANTKCQWVWDNGFAREQSLQSWELATQLIFISGYFMLLVTLILILFRCCCKCCQSSVRFSQILCGFTFVAGILTGSAVIHFWLSVTGQDFAKLFFKIVNLSWAFFAGAIGTGFIVASSVFWFLDSRQQKGFHQFDVENNNVSTEQRRRILRH